MEDKQVAVKGEKNFLQEVLNRTNNFISANKEIVLPPHYDASGAVKSFFLKILDLKVNNKPAIEICTKESIFTAFFDLVSKGLDPRKNQAYPIIYGNQLKLHESYFGNQKAAFTYRPDLVEINAQVIREGDVFEVKIAENGRKTIVKHETKWENADKDITGAYAVAVFKDGTTTADVMSKAQLQKSWAMGRSGGQTHKNFEEEMAKKTVRSRLAKALKNVTDDSATFKEDIYQVDDTENQDIIDIDVTPVENEQKIEEPENNKNKLDKPKETTMPEADGFDDLPLAQQAK